MKYKRGDLLEATETYIAHGCNAQGVMGSGVALQIKKKHPYAYKKYKEHCDIHRTGELPTEVMLGDIIPARGTSGKTIVNMITQDHFGSVGRHVNYIALVSCLQNLVKYGGESITVAIPRIGAGLGGGDWNIIERLIEDFEELNPSIEFTVYDL